MVQQLCSDDSKLAAGVSLSQTELSAGEKLSHWVHDRLFHSDFWPCLWLNKALSSRSATFGFAKYLRRNKWEKRTKETSKEIAKKTFGQKNNKKYYPKTKYGLGSESGKQSSCLWKKKNLIIMIQLYYSIILRDFSL